MLASCRVVLLIPTYAHPAKSIAIGHTPDANRTPKRKKKKRNMNEIKKIGLEKKKRDRYASYDTSYRHTAQGGQVLQCAR